MGKYSKKKKSGGGGRILLVILGVLALFALLGLAARDTEEMPLPTEPTASEPAVRETETVPTETTFLVEEEVEGVTSFSLDGLDIVRYGKYIGLYMEDGTDDFVSNVMMILVANNTQTPVQYAKIILTGPAGDAEFALTTLMPGESVVVLEASRKPYTDQDIYTEAKLENLAAFDEIPTCMEDQLLIEPLDGGFNITNISGEDITGEIAVYFKDMAGDVLYGGITYVCRIQGGMKAGEVRQIMSANFNQSGSRVVFVRISQ